MKITPLMIFVAFDCLLWNMYRKPNPVSSGLQASQNRSQMSQQSFSQGLSSQQMLSHFSQSSLDEAVTANDQVKPLLNTELIEPNIVKNEFIEQIESLQDDIYNLNPETNCKAKLKKG